MTQPTTAHSNRLAGLLAGAALWLALPAAAAPRIIVVPHVLRNVERGIESFAISYRATAYQRGQVTVRRCPRCDAQILPASADIRLYYRGHPVPVKDSAHYRGYAGTVFINLKSNLVDRIRWDRDYSHTRAGSR